MRRRSLQPLFISITLAAFPFLVLSLNNKRAAAYDLGLALPYLLSALVAFLGLKLNKQRIFFVSILVAAAYAFFHWDGRPTPDTAFVALFLPASYLFLFGVPEPKTKTGKWFLLATLVGIPGALLLLGFRHPVAHALLLKRSTLSGVLLPGPALILGAVFAVTALIGRDRFERDFRVFVTLSLVPLFHVLNRTPTELELAVGFVSSQSLLLYGVFRLYWQKVYVDELTGISNRRALNDAMSALTGTCSIAMIDIDHFKRINDTYGHETGDEVLRFVARHLDLSVRGQVYRYGGEEFCVVAGGTSSETAQRMDEVRARLAERPFVIRSSKKVRARTSEKDRASSRGGTETIRVTVSVGVAAFGGSLERPEDVLIAADAALYRAKELGRNRVLLAQIGSSRKREAG